MKIKIIAIISLLAVFMYLGYNKFKQNEINSKVNYSLNKLSQLKSHQLSVNDNSIEYKYLLALQLDRWDIALNLLKPLAEKGDPDAMFWYAYISPNNAFSGSDLMEKFAKAADEGNPYAAMQLSKQGEYCSTYLASYCDEKWKAKAIDILESKKEQGDLLGQYYLHIYKQGKKINLEKNVVDIIYKNARIGDYDPLFNYMVYILGNVSLSKEQMSKFRDIMKTAINSHYIPAMKLAYTFKDELNIDATYIIDNYSQLGGYCMTCMRFYKGIGTRDGILKVGAYHLIKNTLEESKNIFQKFKISDIKVEKDLHIINLYLGDLGLEKLTDDEVLTMKKSAVYSLNNKKIPIYINQANYSR